MFVGESNQKLDAKFRLTIPSQHRRHLEDGMVITRSLDERCLRLYTLEEWNKLATKIEELQNGDRLMRQIRRQFFSQAEEVRMDKQGRILINQKLRTYAEVESEVVVAGNNSYLEIWNQTLWDETTLDLIDESTIQNVGKEILNFF